MRAAKRASIRLVMAPALARARVCGNRREDRRFAKTKKPGVGRDSGFQKGSEALANRGYFDDLPNNFRKLSNNSILVPARFMMTDCWITVKVLFQA